MPSQTIDAIVLGAGIVGVSAALALQARGRTVAIVDRLGEAAGETSYGNTGIVQSEAVFPYLFPREPAEIALAALNRDPRAHIRYGALPAIAPALWRYFRASNDAGKNETAPRHGAVRRRRGGRAPEARRGGRRGRAPARNRLDQGLPHARAARTRRTRKSRS